MHIYLRSFGRFSPGNNFPKSFQLIYIGISFAGEKATLTAFSNKIAQEYK